MEYLQVENLFIFVNLVPHRFHYKDYSQHQHDTYRKGYPGSLDEAGDDVGDKGYPGGSDRIGQLGHHMVDMLTLSPGRRHDGGVGDGRAVISADGSCHTGGDRDDHKLRIAAFKHGHHDGDQDSKGSPGGAGGKGQETSHHEDDGRKEI